MSSRQLLTCFKKLVRTCQSFEVSVKECSLGFLGTFQFKLNVNKSLNHLNERNVSMLTGNCPTVIPVSVGRMSSLRSLDISENSIRELPKELARVRTLEVRMLNGYKDFEAYLCSIISSL